MVRRMADPVRLEAERRVEVRVASRVEALRRARGMSRGDLAHALGVSFQQAQKYERGTNRLSAGQLAWLARLLDVPIEAFFAADGDGVAMLDSAERQLLRAWRTLPPVKAEAALELVAGLGQRAGRPQEEPAAAPHGGSVGAASMVEER